MPFCSCNLFTRVTGISRWCYAVKRVRCNTKPEAGGCEEAEVHTMFAGGAHRVKPVDLGVGRIRPNCMPIPLRNREPATKQCFGLLFIDCNIQR